MLLGRSVDILPAASGEGSYGLSVCFSRDGFGGFLPQPLYFSGGPRRGFTFGLPAHRSFGQKKYGAVRKEKKEGPYILGLKTPRLYGPPGKRNRNRGRNESDHFRLLFDRTHTTVATRLRFSALEGTISLLDWNTERRSGVL